MKDLLFGIKEKKMGNGVDRLTLGLLIGALIMARAAGPCSVDPRSPSGLYCSLYLTKFR